MSHILSIIIPVYNHSAELRRCLQGIAQQTWRDLEVIIVDDGSNPPIGEITNNQYPISNIRIEHRGAAAARNAGAKEARGEFLLFCDADVVMTPHCLERMHETLAAHPEASYAYSSFRFGWKKFSALPFDAARLRQMNYIHTTSLIRRAHFPEFDETLKKFQDWDLWLTMLEHGRTGGAIPEVLFSVTPRRGGMSKWIPRFGYQWPWRLLWPHTVREYEHWREVIAKKHSGR